MPLGPPGSSCVQSLQTQTQPPPGRVKTDDGPVWPPMTCGPRVPVARSATAKPSPVRTMMLAGVGSSPSRTSFGSSVAAGDELADGPALDAPGVGDVLPEAPTAP